MGVLAETYIGLKIHDLQNESIRKAKGEEIYG
jgi:hypothetical protein